MVEVNSETDFVAKDENFLNFANAVIDTILQEKPADLAALLELGIIGGDNNIEEARQQLISKIGENINIRRFTIMNGQGDHTGAYVHGGRIGVLVELAGGTNEIARDIAMHIAALNPEFIDVDDVPADVLEKEKQFLISQAADSGKPAEIIEKMVVGRMRKHLSSITLLGQDFVKDGDITVAKLLEQNGASVSAFTRLAVGEGIEKKEDNFAEEVMQQVKGG